MSDLVIEHGESVYGRRLRRNRIRIALAVAAIEGIVVLAGTIPWWVVVVLAAASVTLYVAVRSTPRSEVAQLAWIAAFSQSVLVLVPIVAGVVLFVAILLIVTFAAVAVVALVRDRR